MNIVRRILASLLLAACIIGAVFVVADTLTRGHFSGDVGTESTPSSTTQTTSGATVNTFTVGNTKNPFVPLAQLPATATTQPKTP